MSSTSYKNGLIDVYWWLNATQKMNCTRWDILSKLAFLSVLLEIITNTYPIRNLTNDTERNKNLA